MNETELSKEAMDSVNLLAQTNVKIGIAKGALIKLEQEETAYLEEREKKAVGRIQKLFDDSKELLEGIKSNYQEVKQLLRDASSLSDFLVKAYEQFKALVNEFNERDAAWQAQVAQKEEEFGKIRQQIDNDKVRIKNDRDGIQKAKASLVVERRKIDDDRQTLARAITRLKEGRI